jgi:hypothetical protein
MDQKRIGDSNKLNLKVLNEVKPNILQYLPYGVTTLEIKIEGEVDELLGYIYPNNLADREKKLYVGFADQSEDFLVLWGAGSEGGLEVSNTNLNGRLFFQILHKGNSTETQSITLCHSHMKEPIATIKLVPAEESPNVVKMEMNPGEQSGLQVISFKGSKIPLYYPRWFPPRASENKKIQYYDINAPNIKIKFKVKENDFIPEVNSDIDIFLNDDPNRIARISDDWHYSSLHAEIFTIFGNADYLILRLWCYWIRATFSNTLREGKILITRNQKSGLSDSISYDGQVKRGVFNSINIECPDYERFDFLVDMKKKKIIWVGTDFHYQEWWSKIDDTEPFVRAKIVGGLWTIEHSLESLLHRFHSKENFDPMTILKGMLKEGKTPVSPDNPMLGDYLVSKKKEMLSPKAQGFLGKHIPYPENGKAEEKLVSSIASS